MAKLYCIKLDQLKSWVLKTILIIVFSPREVFLQKKHGIVINTNKQTNISIKFY